MARHLEPIEVERIFLYEENPRHEPIDSEPKVIEHLCKDEQVYNLARSISEAGPNPLELLGLVKMKNSGKRASKAAYEVWEGNRRACAIKLLNDPDLAPPHLRKDFARLASSSAHVPIKEITAVIFDDHDDLKFWMGIIHNGTQSGVGRADWNADQKARHFGSSRNRVALAVLDAAEVMGLISKDERAGKLTTAQRYLHRSVVKEALGIDASNPDDVTFNRPLADLKVRLSKFIADLKLGAKVNSRTNSAQIDAYGRSLERNTRVSDERTQPLSLKNVGSATAKPKRKVKLRQPREITHIEFDKSLSLALERVGNAKLESLYYSICAVHLEHTPLLAVGVWAFIESLAALDGKNPDTDFSGYFSNQRLANHGFGSGKALGPLRDALSHISRNGNATKHHEIAGSFDGKQLVNDVATITPLLLKTIDSIAQKKVVAVADRI